MIFKKQYIFILFLFFATGCMTAQQSMKAQPGSEPVPTISFVETTDKDLPGQPKNLRKWDVPAVADLDQDGYPDLILNDHGLAIKICWNNKGKFSKPYDLIMGDIHGVSVGDFDQDGNLELVLSRGGGSGSNARNSKIYRVDKSRNFTALPNFEVPLEMMRGRTVKFMDGDNDGDLDLLNFAFPGKEKKGSSENYIYRNDQTGELLLAGTLPPSSKDGQKTLLTDFNGDHILDFVMYGQGDVKAYQGKGDLTFEEVSEKIFPTTISHVTSVIELDYDNDGDFDLFFTRGKEFVPGETFFDPSTKTLGFFTRRGDFDFNNLKTGEVLNLENYHTQWPFTNQLYIGETGYDYEHPGENHSGKNLKLIMSNALGFPDKLNKSGIHIGYVGNENWRIAGNTRGPLTCVIHGVEKYPAYEHAPGLTDILLENNNGTFHNVTKAANLQLADHTSCVTVLDIDQNGWEDLVISRRGNLIHKNQATIFLNQGNKKFIKSSNHGVISNELGGIGMAIEVLDYNLDGKMDVIIGNERGRWRLFKNNSKETENRSITIKVGTSESGKASSLNALVEVTNCDNKQVRRIGRTAASYSQGFDSFVNFGLGNCSTPVTVKVTWTNGETMEKSITGEKMVNFGK